MSDNILPSYKQMESLINAVNRIAGGANLDNQFAALLDDTNTTEIFKKWYALENNGTVTKYELLSRFFNMCAIGNDQQHTVQFYAASVSGANEGTPLDWLADKKPAPLATDTVDPGAGWDEENRLTWYIRANALSLADGTMNVLYIEGVDAEFDITGAVAPVYTFMIAPWFKETVTENYETRSWRATHASGYKPYPWDVAPDGTKRSMTWHPSFSGGNTSDGKLTSGAGRRVDDFVSAAQGLVNARKWNAYEGLWNDGDTKWLLFEWQHRHFLKENSGVLEGCTGYSYQYTAAITESGTNRIVLTTAQGANFIVGSSVIVGYNGANTTDRGSSYMRALSGGIVEIIEINAVNIEGTDYKEIVLNLANNIDVTAGETYISTMPWDTGMTEVLPGHRDGSPGSLTNGHYPCRIAGVEVLVGTYDIGLDPLYIVTANETSGFDYAVYECKDSEKLTGSTSVDTVKSVYEDTGITLIGKTAGWEYVKDFVQTDKAILLPNTFGGSSTSYYRSGFDGAYSSGVRCPWRFGGLGYWSFAGLACGYGSISPAGSFWSGSPRLAGSGKKRGEWTTT